jgi:hypothetical protein
MLVTDTVDNLSQPSVGNKKLFNIDNSFFLEHSTSFAAKKYQSQPQIKIDPGPLHFFGARKII